MKVSRKPIWLVWCADIKGDSIMYYLRAVCTSEKNAELYKLTVEHEPHRAERRCVTIEKNMTNHLYGECILHSAGVGPRGNVP